jgi:hypothetical protein
MTKEVLASLIEYLYAEPRSLRVWRTVWRVNLAFYALLRWDDVCRLQVNKKNDFNTTKADNIPIFR